MTIRNKIQLTQDTTPTTTKTTNTTLLLTENTPTASADASSSSSSLTGPHVTQLNLMNGLIYFEIFQFFYLLKPMFVSLRHLDSNHSHHHHHHHRLHHKSWSSILTLQQDSHQCHKCLINLSGIGAQLENEFDGIRRDLLDLLNPHLSYEIKLEYLKRMRYTHKSLS